MNISAAATPKLDRMLRGLPLKMQNKVSQTMENISLVAEIRDPKVGASM